MTTSRATQRLIDAAPGFDIDVHTFPEGTKTADDAATAIGCPVAAIVKSLVFVVAHADGTEEPTVSLVPGDRRLDTEKLASAAGGVSARRATLDEVKEATGFTAGGTPPFGHQETLRVLADPSLRRNDPVWAAAGTPSTVFPISLADLNRIAEPTWTDLTEDNP